MDFSDAYFTHYTTLPQLFSNKPDANTGLIVVIPCYDDAHIFNTLQSLENTTLTKANVEVIVVVNSSVLTPENIIRKNRDIFAELKNKSESDYYHRFKLLPFIIEDIPRKTSGVGKARKTGMDEAVRRFAFLQKPEGIILSLDADTLVSPEYFSIIENTFACNPKKGGCTIQFKHDFNTKLYTSEEINACKLYEIYLRYFRLSLQFAGFPYALHTIGSCFAVRAAAYVKTGGMPCKQGGEDFYFLHKLVQVTDVITINEILVYPSPRISNRVPFGTGPSISNIIDKKSYHVYNFRLFLILKDFFNCLYHIAETGTAGTVTIPEEIIHYIGTKKLTDTINECIHNAKPGKNLQKRLFSKFDAFFIVKWLNSYGNDSNFPPMEVTEAATWLLKYSKTL